MFMHIITCSWSNLRACSLYTAIYCSCIRCQPIAMNTWGISTRTAPHSAGAPSNGRRFDDARQIPAPPSNPMDLEQSHGKRQHIRVTREEARGPPLDAGVKTDTRTALHCLALHTPIPRASHGRPLNLHANRRCLGPSHLNDHHYLHGRSAFPLPPSRCLHRIPARRACCLRHTAGPASLRDRH